MTQGLDIQALIAQAIQAEIAKVLPTNVGQTTEEPTTNVVDCGRCSGKHQGRHVVNCPNKDNTPTNVGNVSAPPVVQSADVLSRRTFTLTKVKVSKNSEKWSFADPEGKTWVDVTLPLGSGLGDVLNLAVS